MGWRVEYTKAALKQLKKMDRFDARLILSWIGKNLEGCEDPRVHGKGLTENRTGEWRYRVGDYRVLCLLEDDRLIVEVFSVGHRSEIYKVKRGSTYATTKQAAPGSGARSGLCFLTGNRS